ncbi:Uncharacterised protein [Sebaldella termitidis]|uniref:Uncharacterized protein n=1 Tax=Sebaldella termitidis (strain ATCC 33386 / NCTC 11300) TaxID=526218 RepID=D1AN91_SEBTE|nr:hypothetical protein [Sebaldella termitidis]ACZ09695.1 hypothetical protein Sterm_2851 [Sebaldella termitidis ATCC 33386]SUI25026.1 Uncharacterised protein [Sebaldella termitidis]
MPEKLIKNMTNREIESEISYCLHNMRTQEKIIKTAENTLNVLKRHLNELNDVRGKK